MTTITENIGGNAIIPVANNQLTLGNTNTLILNAPAPVVSGQVYTFHDVGSNAQFIMDAGAQTFTGAKTFSSASGVTITNPTNQLTLGAANPLILSAVAQAASGQVYTFPDVGASTQFVLSAGTQMISGAKTFSSAAGLTVSGAGGFINTQASNQITLGATGHVLIVNSTAPAAASNTYTIPDLGTTGNFILDVGTQTISGAKTFSSASGIVVSGAGGVNATTTTNQITLNTGAAQATLNASGLSAATVFSLPTTTPISTTLVAADGASTINSDRTFTGNSLHTTGLNPSIALVITNTTYVTGLVTLAAGTVTGSGTTFPVGVVGGVIVINTTPPVEGWITARNSATSLTITNVTSAVGSNTNYTIYYGGFQTDTSGNIGANTIVCNNLITPGTISYSGSVNTNSATPTTLITIPTTSNFGYAVNFQVNATAVSTDSVASYSGFFQSKNTGGSLTVTAIANYTTILDTPTFTATSVGDTFSGTNILIQVTGTGTAMKWTGVAQVVSQSY
jgi:hypothetical protein